jgi:toxin-antitoxin system PIN domain toxin
MTSYLIDINVWLALTWGLHPQHGAASRWYQSINDEELLFCRFTMLGFLRLLTNEKVMGDSTATLQQAFEMYDEWSGDARITLAPEPRGMEVLLRDAAVPFLSQSATKAVADCYLAGFAEARGARLVTFDRGLAGIARFRKSAVVLLDPE